MLPAPFTYTPNPDFFGIDTWEYTTRSELDDTTPQTTLVTVEVLPVNDPPVRIINFGQPILLNFTLENGRLSNATVDLSTLYDDIDSDIIVISAFGLESTGMSQFNIYGDGMDITSALRNGSIVVLMDPVIIIEPVFNETDTMMRLPAFDMNCSASDNEASIPGSEFMFRPGPSIRVLNGLDKTLILATTIPIGLCMLCAIAALLVMTFYFSAHKTILETFVEKAQIEKDDIILGEEIGSGQFGQVYKATWHLADVAVKTVKLSALSPETSEENKEKALQDFLEEARLAHNLRAHENVTTFFGVSTQSDPYYIVMEFCDGGSLQSYRSKHGPFSPETQLNYAKQIAAGMHHLHAEDLIHRDLAARNIMLKNGICKVADLGYPILNLFSISSPFLFSRLTINLATQVSLNQIPVKWTAPEALSRGIFSPASDAYSYGVVLYEISQGHPPWTGYTNRQVRDLVVSGKTYELPATMLPTYLKLIHSCSGFLPETRYSFKEIKALLDSDTHSKAKLLPQTTFSNFVAAKDCESSDSNEYTDPADSTYKPSSGDVYLMTPQRSKPEFQRLENNYLVSGDLPTKPKPNPEGEAIDEYLFSPESADTSKYGFTPSDKKPKKSKRTVSK